MDRIKSLHRGWLLPPVCFIMVMSGCFFATGMSITLAGIRSIYGLSATSTASITTVRSVVSILAIFVSGEFFGKLGLRKGMSLSMFIGSIACAIYAFADGRIAVYYAAAAISGITYAYGIMFAVSMLLKRWFVEKRGIAMAVASSGTGFTSIIWAPVIQKVILNHGMRAAFLIEGGVMLISAALLYLVVVDDPAELGLEPVGGLAKPAEGATQKRLNDAPVLSKKWSALLIFAIALVATAASPAATHLSLNFTFNGADSMTVAKAMSIYGFMLIAAKLVFGVIQDRFGNIATMIIFGVLHIAGDILVGIGGMFPASTPFIFLSFIVFGLGVPCETLGYPNWCADLTSAEDYPVLLKKAQLGYQIGGLIFTTVPGIICDATGSYGWYFILSAFVLIAAFIIVYLAYRSYGKQSRA